jgi:O-antigen/teichoic acid export membrane protein
VARTSEQYLLTFATEGINAGAWVATYRLAALFWGGSGFAEYALIRRSASWVVPLLMFGLGVAIPRFVAYSRATRQGLGGEYLLAGACVVGGLSFLLVGCVSLLDRSVSYLVFGDVSRVALITPFALLATGQALHAVNYSYLRGMEAMRAANGIQLIAGSVIPLAAVVSFRDSLQAAVLGMAAGTIIFSTAILVWLLARLRPQQRFRSTHLRSVVRFGMARLHGDFLLTALLGWPATVATHRFGLVYGGSVAFGLSLLGMAGSALAPIGIIQLPRAARMFGEARHREVAGEVRRLLIIATVVSLGAVLLVEASLSWVLKVLIGPGASTAVTPARIIVTAAPFYVLFLCARGVIDAYYRRAANARNITIAVGVYAALEGCSWALGSRPWADLLAFTSALVVLGGLTILELRRMSQKSGSEDHRKLWVP